MFKNLKNKLICKNKKEFDSVETHKIKYVFVKVAKISGRVVTLIFEDENFMECWGWDTPELKLNNCYVLELNYITFKINAVYNANIGKLIGEK